jgi:hypothetical protein
MQVTAKQRALIIARVCERLATGQSLNDACAAEVKGATALKTSTFMLWVRRYGRAGDVGADGKTVEQGERSPVQKVVPFYGMRSSKCAVLGGSGDWLTLGGVGTSFSSYVRTRLIAEFDEKKGIELCYRSSSFTAWIADSGRVTHEVVGSGLRSIEAIWEAVAAFGDPQYSYGVDPGRAANNAREAFPWLPEEIVRPSP